jgi:hypothetical protein
MGKPLRLGGVIGRLAFVSPFLQTGDIEPYNSSLYFRAPPICSEYMLKRILLYRQQSIAVDKALGAASLPCPEPHVQSWFKVDAFFRLYSQSDLVANPNVHGHENAIRPTQTVRL